MSTEKPSLIDSMLKFPSMAAPFSSSDKGEVWLWDNYHCLFQKSPKTVYEISQSLYPPELKSMPVSMTYHYVMTVLKVDYSEESPEFTLSVGVEQVIADGYRGDVMLGIFRTGMRENLGRYNNYQHATENDVKLKLMEITNENLSFSSIPEMIGTIPDLYPKLYDRISQKKSLFRN